MENKKINENEDEPVFVEGNRVQIEDLKAG